jgi:hypothetical protein
MFHDKSKHIEIMYHYIRDMVQKGGVKLQYVATDEKIAYVTDYGTGQHDLAQGQ